MDSNLISLYARPDRKHADEVFLSLTSPVLSSLRISLFPRCLCISLSIPSPYLLSTSIHANLYHFLGANPSFWQSKYPILSSTTFSYTPTSLSALRPSVFTSHKKTFVSQASPPNSLPEILENIQNFLRRIDILLFS